MIKQNMPRLTESQLFTIEALNRIERFAWPKGAEFYEVDGGHVAYFCGDASGAMASVRIKGVHDKTIINETVTKAEFYSVDGWVRNTGLKLPTELLDSQVEVLHHNGEIAFDDANAFYWDENVDKWRYRKPSNAEVNKAPSITDPALYFARRSFSWVGCENGFIIPDRIKEVELAIPGGPIIEVLAELDTNLQKQGWPKFQSAHIDLKRVICNNTNQNITAHVIRYLPIDAREEN